ncbi:MAG: hypothetical protein ACRYGP_17505 [Janthinobacterium lividum]
MSDRLPPLPPEEAEFFGALETHDSVSVGTDRARVDMRRKAGRIIATITCHAPELRDHPVTIEGNFANYREAFFALTADIEASVRHARTGRPSH